LVARGIVVRLRGWVGAGRVVVGVVEKWFWVFWLCGRCL
jgi:hypothetical protein